MLLKWFVLGQVGWLCSRGEKQLAHGNWHYASRYGDLYTHTQGSSAGVGSYLSRASLALGEQGSGASATEVKCWLLSLA